jgi:hypothetical protein
MESVEDQSSQYFLVCTTAGVSHVQRAALPSGCFVQNGLRSTPNWPTSRPYLVEKAVSNLDGCLGHAFIGAKDEGLFRGAGVSGH